MNDDTKSARPWAVMPVSGRRQAGPHSSSRVTANEVAPTEKKAEPPVEHSGPLEFTPSKKLDDKK